MDARRDGAGRVLGGLRPGAPIRNGAASRPTPYDTEVERLARMRGKRDMVEMVGGERAARVVLSEDHEG